MLSSGRLLILTIFVAASAAGSPASARQIALLVHAVPPLAASKVSFEVQSRRFARLLRRTTDVTPLAVRAFSPTELTRKLRRLNLGDDDRIVTLAFTGEGGLHYVGGLDFNRPETWAALAELRPYLDRRATVALVTCSFLPPDIAGARALVEDYMGRLGAPDGRLFGFSERIEDLRPDFWMSPFEQATLAQGAAALGIVAAHVGVTEALLPAALLGGYAATRVFTQWHRRSSARGARFELRDGRATAPSTMTLRELQRRLGDDACNEELVSDPS